MFTCPALCILGIVLSMWGFIWAIFLPEFIWLFVVGMVLGVLFSKDC